MAVPGPDTAEPVGAGWESVVLAIGPKLRDARQHLGLSLQQLAGRSEVSAAAIHKVERGDMVPTITTLLKLAAALGAPITHFVGDGDPAAPVAVHVPADARQAPPATWAPAARGVAASGVAAPTELLRAGGVLAEVEPGGASGDTRPLRAGEEVVHVLDGTLVVEVAGVRHVVRAGDTLHYPTDRPHEWHNPGPAAARAIWFTVRG
ncbi:MAG TPA: cupin domain-containing protein [Pseudonocardia sp.]|jgi:transcriptional regulator with XRE-family HTH domain|nr:cupin domain-containing protein [Pseudonocardia sp.]